MVLGTPQMTTGRLTFAVASVAYLLIGIPLEERSLLTQHGDAYRAYQRAVRSAVIPGLYSQGPLP